MESKSELACVYAALMLADDDIEVTANIKFVEPYLPGLFANALSGRNIKDMLSVMSAPSTGGAPAAGGAAAPAAAETKVHEKAPAKEVAKVESEESDEDMGFDLFG